MSFNIAAEEQKINSRDEMLDQVSQPMVSVPQLPSEKLRPTTLNNSHREKKEVMRKHMTRVISEVMEIDQKIVYIGEDVEHGGYYLVTDGLADKFKGRVIDFPPDETTLLGSAMGFAQVGLLPIVEIPYAKYLDCAADMFYELSLSNWLTNGQCPNGMIIRVQGFDRGGESMRLLNELPLDLTLVTHHISSLWWEFSYTQHDIAHSSWSRCGLLQQWRGLCQRIQECHCPS